MLEWEKRSGHMRSSYEGWVEKKLPKLFHDIGCTSFIMN